MVSVGTTLRWASALTLVGAACVACGSDKAGGLGGKGDGGSGGTSAGAGGDAGSGAGPTGGSSGSAQTAGSGGVQSSGGAAGALNGGSGGTSGGSGGSGGGPGGAAGAAGAGGTAGAAGSGGSELVHCVFHSDVSGAGGVAGAAGAPAETVGSATSPFLGQYLTDAGGITLYTYGSDVPGDCDHAPVSGCVGDCLLSWPLFDADPRVLGAGLDDANFGSFLRADGARQTTYMGWPLYYYKNDTSPGLIAGQGKAKLWHAAEVIPPELVVLRNGSTKYLGDRWGFAFYAYAADELGSGGADPVAKCAGSCASQAKPVRGKQLSHVTSLAESDFSVFTSPGVGQQLAYKGIPLYYSTADKQPGDLAGVNVVDFALVEP
ncbi:MAG: hypothetical protein H6718_17840 [Polyangiaceae bacterium]|nr:hypothetical protein [Polyangiaceae bacterium]